MEPAVTDRQRIPDHPGSYTPDPTVTIVRCPDYDPERVKAAVVEALDALGGMAGVVRPGERIALKPNLLLPQSPDACITTHPAVVEAVAREVQEAGATPVFLESPAAALPSTPAAITRLYRKTGLLDVAQRLGIEVCTELEPVAVSHTEGVLVKRLDVLAPLLKVDGLISLPKFKTHYFMVFTGAVKNLFGLVPGLAKPGYHAKLDDPGRFADMLLDISTFVRPRLTVMDAVMGLEGDGPGTAGRPRWIGAVVAGRDPVAIDVACCRIGGFDPRLVPVLVAAARRGWWRPEADWPPLNGASPEELKADGLALPGRRRDAAGFGRLFRLQDMLVRLARGALTPRPRPKEGRCIACRTCERACPRGAITVRDGLARVDDGRCIRCYCCHEMCPVAAIDVEFTGMGRVMHTLRLV